MFRLYIIYILYIVVSSYFLCVVRDFLNIVQEDLHGERVWRGGEAVRDEHVVQGAIFTRWACLPGAHS